MDVPFVAITMRKGKSERRVEGSQSLVEDLKNQESDENLILPAAFQEGLQCC